MSSIYDKKNEIIAFLFMIELKGESLKRKVEGFFFVWKICILVVHGFLNSLILFGSNSITHSMSNGANLYCNFFELLSHVI